MRAEHRPTQSRTNVVTPPKPRYSLRHKAVVWTLGMAIIPTVVYAVWINTVAHNVMNSAQEHSLAVLGQTVARSLAGRVPGGWTAEADRILDGLNLDPRLAFVIVTNAQGRRMHRRAADADAWLTYARWLDEEDEREAIEIDATVRLGEEGDLRLRRFPILNPPVRAGNIELTDVRHRELEGFVFLAARDHSIPAALANLQAMHLIAAIAVCALVLPVIIWAVGHWTAPLRSLLNATIRLGGGESPEPIHVATRDELGLLANAFNGMVGRLAAARQQLQQANEDLEHKVEQRTAELAEVNHRLELEIQDKNAFLRAVSHDLGAPLRNIEGMTSMLLGKYRAALADDALNKLERINVNVKLQVDLINDLLELSRIRTRPGRKQRVDLHQLVEELAQGLSYDLERKGITFTIDRPLPTVLAERNRMRQVFQNLLDNAVKYMDDRPPREIRVGYQPEPRAHHFTVTDTGPGIKTDEHDKIFHVFRRGEHGGATGVGGRGIGLASVKTIIECAGGRIWVESRVGQGATFHFTLDRAQADPAEASDDRQPARANATDDTATATAD